MMEFISKLTPDQVVAWLPVIMGLMTLVSAYFNSKHKNRWDIIRSLIPDAHRLAQKVAKNTKTRKDDEFLRIMARLLGAFGIKLTEAEKEAVREMGSAEHQTFKVLRDSGGIETNGSTPGQVLELVAEPGAEGKALPPANVSASTSPDSGQPESSTPEGSPEVSAE